MELDERKRKIMQAIVDDYITTAEPVGSRSIARKFEMGISSATIRNEMADLEQMGYLAQPHTSAGRIPSDKGYRLYVDSLMNQYKMTVDEIARIKSALEFNVNKMENIIERIAGAVSDITQYTTMITKPRSNKVYVKKIDIVLIDSSGLLLVVITNEGLVKNQIFRFDAAKLNDEFVNKLSNALNSAFVGLTLDEIDTDCLGQIADALSADAQMIAPVINFILEKIYHLDDSDIYVNAATALLNYPEYSDLDRVRELLGFLENKYNLRSVIAEDDDNAKNNKLNIVIGRENKCYQLHDCSIITSNYSAGNKVLGTIGIIGPKRMNYARVVASLDNISKYVNKILQEIYFDNERE